jgi:predicted dehydrogenase
MRAAIIGTGYIARVHGRLIGELQGRVIAVCGRTRSSAAQFGVGEPYDNISTMLREQRPDVVHVCSPNHLHAEQAIAALQAGAHVLCEKPLATSAEDARRMIDAAAKAGRIGAVAYCYRGYPLVEILRARVAAGGFGALRRVGGCYLSQDVVPPDKYVWHFSPGQVGPAFALMDYGVHWFDLLEFVTGERIREMLAQFSTHQRQRVWRGGIGEGPKPAGTQAADGSVQVDVRLEEQADLLIRLSNGAAGAATISGAAPGHPNTIILSADGPERGFDWNQQDANVYLERHPSGNTVRQRAPEDMPADRAWMTMVPAGHVEGYLDAFRNVIQQAWRAMQGEAMVYPTFADGLRGVRLVEAAVQSARTGRPVDTSD